MLLKNDKDSDLRFPILNKYIARPFRLYCDIDINYNNVLLANMKGLVSKAKENKYLAVLTII